MENGINNVAVSQIRNELGQGMAQPSNGLAAYAAKNAGAVSIDGKIPITKNGQASKDIDTNQKKEVVSQGYTGRPNLQGPGGMPPMTDGLAGRYSNIPNLYTTPNSNYTIMGGMNLI